MEFVVDRKTWQRGQKFNSSLLTSDGKRCCLGFLAQQCQVQDIHLRMLLPSFLKMDQKTKLPQSLFQKVNIAHLPERVIHCLDLCLNLLYESLLENILAGINDSDLLTDQEREALLTELFAANDIQVTFQN